MEGNARPIYFVDDSHPIEIPPRTPLYHFEPIGIGTREVESLASYISRLAAIYHTRVLKLLDEAIVPALPSHFCDAKQALIPSIPRSITLKDISGDINGINSITRTLATVLKYLTGVDSLRLLTLLPLEGVLADKYLLRETHAWCPVCYGSQSGHQPIHDLLSWSLQTMNICPKHSCRLQHQCPNEDCRRIIPRLHGNYQPGYCPYCGCWLGNIALYRSEQLLQSKAGGEDFDHYSAESIGETLVTASVTDGPPNIEKMRVCLESLVKKYAAGRVARFAHAVSLPQSTVYGLLKLGTVPTLPSILKICYFTGISLSAFVVKAEITLVSMPRLSHPPAKPRLHKFVNSQVIAASLEAIIRSGIVLSHHDVERQLGVSWAYIRIHYPHLAGKIGLQYKTFRDQKTQTERETVRNQLQDYLNDDNQSAVSLEHMAKKLGKNTTYLRKHFPDLCLQIVRGYKEWALEKRAKSIKAICQEVIFAVYRFHNQCIYPSATKVHTPLKSWMVPEARAARKQAMRELGYDV